MMLSLHLSFLPSVSPPSSPYPRRGLLLSSFRTGTLHQTARQTENRILESPPKKVPCCPTFCQRVAVRPPPPPSPPNNHTDLLSPFPPGQRADAAGRIWGHRFPFLANVSVTFSSPPPAKAPDGFLPFLQDFLFLSSSHEQPRRPWVDQSFFRWAWRPRGLIPFFFPFLPPHRHDRSCRARLQDTPVNGPFFFSPSQAQRKDPVTSFGGGPFFFFPPHGQQDFGSPLMRPGASPPGLGQVFFLFSWGGALAVVFFFFFPRPGQGQLARGIGSLFLVPFLPFLAGQSPSFSHGLFFSFFFCPPNHAERCKPS